MKKITFGLGATALLFGACAEGPQSTTDDFGYEGTGIQVSIAPLTLDSLSDACYSFAIKNEAGQLVVGRGPGAAATNIVPGDPDAEPPILPFSLVTGTAAQTVCASQFGNGDGGDISYVAPCDAQEPLHTVTLWVDALCDSGADPDDLTKDGAANWDTASTAGPICVEMQDYVNPCGSGGCTLDVTCAENQDTPVTFNFTIMGQADQGFFDVAVNFDDVFCSAKVDTCNTVGDPIQLVFDAAGNRVNTVVAAIACTAGEKTDTYLQHTNLEFDCGGLNRVLVEPHEVDEEGNQAGPGDPIQWAAYFGVESLPGMSKVYSNFAFEIPEGGPCTLTWQVVPSNGEFVAPTVSNTYSSFGYVDFDVSEIRNGVCQTNPLDFQGSGVTTDYASTGNADGFIPDLVSMLSLKQQDAEDIVAWPSQQPSPEQ